MPKKAITLAHTDTESITIDMDNYEGHVKKIKQSFTDYNTAIKDVKKTNEKIKTTIYNR